MKQRKLTLLAACLLALSIGCAHESSETFEDKELTKPKATSVIAGTAEEGKVESEDEPQMFEVRGVVKEVKAEDSRIVINHEEIPDYMPAMTMPFEVKDTNELAGIASGDQVTFRMVVTEEEGWIENIERIGVADPSTQEPQRRTFRPVREVEPLEVGDVMPNYTFTNSLGKKISLSDYKGKAYAFTFIFTRCPFPNFCPRMNSNFADAYQQLTSMENAPTNWHLLTISFDPDFDTPEQLRRYSQTYDPDSDKWDFATGAMIDIDAITEQFGLGFAFREGTIDHNLRTVVVDAAGKVQHVLIGNEWTADELVAELIKGARAQPGKTGEEER